MLPITPEIARASTELDLRQGDPADRLIAATAVVNGADLVTIGERLRDSQALKMLW